MTVKAPVRLRAANFGLIVYCLLIAVVCGAWGLRETASLAQSVPSDATDTEIVQRVLVPALILSVAALAVIHAFVTVIVLRNLLASKGRQFIMGVSLWNLIAFPVGTWVGWKTYQWARSQSPDTATSNLRN